MRNIWRKFVQPDVHTRSVKINSYRWYEETTGSQLLLELRIDDQESDVHYGA